MSAVCVLTPIVVSSWPLLASAMVGAAASMGFSVQNALPVDEPVTQETSVEVEIENSEVIADEMTRGQTVVVQKDDLTIEFGQDARGACTVCVTGEGHTKRALRRIGEEVAGRVVQQFAYHKLMTELKNRDYSVVDEEVLADESVRLHVRL